MKWMILLLILFLLLPASIAMTFEEFALSYDYGFNPNNLTINNISVEDCNPCNNLTLELEIGAEPGTYIFNGFLGGKTAAAQQYLFGGNDFVELVFYPPFEDDMTLWLKVSEDSELAYFGDVWDVDAGGLSFVLPKVNVNNDFEEDGALMINVTVEVLQPGNYRIKGYLDDDYVSSLNAYVDAKADVIISFNPQTNGFFTLTGIAVGEYILPLDYQTSNYSFSKFRVINESVFGGDLVIYFENDEGNNVSMFLYDTFSNFITFGSSGNNLSVFSGQKINESELNGPYVVKAVVGGKSYDYVTQYYNHTQFYKKEEAITPPRKSCVVLSSLITFFKNKKNGRNYVRAFEKVMERKCGGSPKADKWPPKKWKKRKFSFFR